MSIEISSLTGLSTDRVAARRAFIAQLLAEKYPELDLKRGVVHDILVHGQSILGEVTAENIDRYNRGRSLLEIEADPTLADPDIVDGVLSCWGIDRLIGKSSTGVMTVILSSRQLVTVAKGAIFRVGDRQYTVDETYTARPSGTIGINDRELTPLDDGTYSFTVNVTAAAVGEAYRLAKNTLMVPDVLPSYFVKAYAAEDFVNGEDEETNAALIARLRAGIAAKTLSGPINMDALLREHSDFAGVVSTSLVGMGDAEMLRDRHWIWPTAGGGRLDYYVRTQARPQRVVSTKTATYVGSGVWQFAIDKQEVPGFYDVTQILLPTDSNVLGSFEITKETRTVDLTDPATDVAVPDIATVSEAAYTAYQAAVIQFKDDVTPLTGLTAGESTADYKVTIRYMPQIAEIQNYLGSRRVRPGAADILVKAPVPCFLQLSFTIFKPATDLSITPAVLSQIQTALAETVNGYGFSGQLRSSVLAEVVHRYIDNPAALSSIDMFGLIRRPDQTIKPIRSYEVIAVPNEPAKMVTPRTVVFILEPTDVAITVENA